MSDPFEAFESALNLNSESAPVNNDFVDPAAEFLAQQQAEMAKIENTGFDAFGDFNAVASTKNENAVLSSGFEEEDPFGTVTSAAPFQPAQTFDEPKNNSNSPSSDWEVVDKIEEKPSDLYSAISSVDKLTNEPETMKIWREEQKKRLETKDAEEELKRKEWKETARKELDDWYKNRKEQLEKKHADNKAAEAELAAPRDTEPGKEWEKVGKLTDFNPKANKNVRDVSRMRSILLQLKQQPLVR
ncbi:unnamed protein product [Brachionus calyciflorus]|uniref:Clathrin light chain n=1 Tax=Brachionus calyciflorus TaxID=104777 RepID=A0A813RS88_9BILA|nr:unnamed protein product [Brachionus calyciflorus]